MSKNTFYTSIALILSLLLLAGCAAVAAGGGVTDSAKAASSVNTGTSDSVSSVTTTDPASLIPSTISSDYGVTSASGGWALKTVSEEGYNVFRLGYFKPYDNDERNLLESYDGEIKVLTESEFKKTYPDTYARPSAPDTGWIIIVLTPTILKVGETYRIPVDILLSEEVAKRHIHVADWKISDTSVLKMIDWDPLKGCNVEALKPGKVKVTMTVKMDDGSYKKSTTVYVLAEDKPLPVIKRKIVSSVLTEEERRAMQPESEPAVSTDESHEPFSSRGTSF